MLRYKIMGYADSPEGDRGIFDGIEGIAGIDEQLDRVEGRDLLPWWLDGVTINSNPATLMLAIMTEQEEVLASYQTDPEGPKKLSDINQCLDIFAEMHKGHREIMRNGHSPIVALACTLDTVCGAIEKGDRPFSGLRIEEWEPFVHEVANAYREFYAPSQPMRS